MPGVWGRFRFTAYSHGKSSWGGKDDSFSLYTAELPAIWDALQPLVRHPAVVQISTYDVSRGQNPQDLVENCVKASRPGGWQGPITVRVDRSMMSLLFWSDVATDMRLDGLQQRFDDWITAIDRRP